jgi:hypothetical protein
MSIEAMKQALEALRNAEVVYMEQLNAMYALQQAIEFAEMVEKGTKAWADTPDMPDHFRDATKKVLSHQPVAHLWECLGRWSAYLASHGGEAELAPPQWLCDAINAATAPPKREWVGLTEKEAWECWVSQDHTKSWQNIEAKLKEKNHG